ncbi:hypothetical protein GZH47_33575 (plasmid) [Paenibacillus rhizovicinus]|uniref:Uncharacterized protein n=1 Tax=Paenibacillus rhizovicinus TaxID=2704463 RepID=A0A6C0PB68_9BACL|nr:hypothetical protein [Paenibacillus rhizovicinus]QHW35824.1 hypothetical protein GZH47_33575 [Paenibacillus rhizovicinus]
MERLLNQSKAFLSVLQSQMTDEDKAKSRSMAEEMFEEISKIVNKNNANWMTTTNASIAVMLTVLELAMEQVEERRKQEDEDK